MVAPISFDQTNRSQNPRRTSVEAKFQELKNRLLEINDLNSAAALLTWDQTTYMPPGGAPARGRQIATLGKLAHEKFTDPTIGKLLDELTSYEKSLLYDSDEASFLRVTRRDYEKAVKVPAAFIAELFSHAAKTYDIWTKARPANDFTTVRPYLEKTLDLSRKYANFYPGYEHIADPLIDDSDEGMKASTVKKLFAQLREQLVPIVKAITSQPAADDSCLKKNYPEAQQWPFGVEVIKRFGYDFSRGRQDKTHHPYCIKFSLGDVRITTRFKENDLGEGLFSTLHESGHAMYEQGICMDLEGTPLARGTSSGVHESQSRSWENLVGRSRGFWEFFYPKLQQTFPQQLRSVSLDTFYRAINKVERSLIRTDADEVTYNLHVMMRFDFELQMLEGKLAIKDLPEAWRERFKADFGIAPPDDKDGCLQDVHWYGGVIGGVFQGYTLGNILSAQFFETAVKAHPEIKPQIKQGEFATLYRWLKENIYQHGRKYTATELVQKVTGGPMSIEPYIRYLKTKYGELYKL
ncbi:carboxypeptidase M32 [Candidatus Acetothermia bacterium]|nr:carboxypeptidase M32 [Candidatus Acetothermia bacterium]